MSAIVPESNVPARSMAWTRTPTLAAPLAEWYVGVLLTVLTNRSANSLAVHPTTSSLMARLASQGDMPVMCIASVPTSSTKLSIPTHTVKTFERGLHPDRRMDRIHSAHPASYTHVTTTSGSLSVYFAAMGSRSAAVGLPGTCV